MKKTEDRGQKTDVRRTRPEVRGQKVGRWEGAKVREGMNSEVGRKHRTEL